MSLDTKEIGDPVILTYTSPKDFLNNTNLSGSEDRKPEPVMETHSMVHRFVSTAGQIASVFYKNSIDHSAQLEGEVARQLYLIKKQHVDGLQQILKEYK